MNANDPDNDSIEAEQTFPAVRDQPRLRSTAANPAQVLLALKAAGFCVFESLPSSTDRQPNLLGVAFTVNPATGGEDIVIETKPTGSVDDACLHQHTPAIHDLARAVMRYLGSPQEVEFAVADDVVYILQSRPIAMIPFGECVGVWTSADFHDGGTSGQWSSPLMASLHEFVWDRMLKSSLRTLRLFDKDFQVSRQCFGRTYWNVGAVTACLSRLPGFVERDFDTELGMNAVSASGSQQGPAGWFRRLRMLPTSWALRAFLTYHEREARAYLDGAFEEIAFRYDRLLHGTARTGGEGPDAVAVFQMLIEQDYGAVESCYLNTSFALVLAKLEFKTAFPDADYAALVCALPEMRGLAPMFTASKENDLASTMRSCRHHCRYGLDVMHPRWDEDRAFVESWHASLGESVGNDGAPRYNQARANALARLPFWKRAGFCRLLDCVRTFVWLREEMRDLSWQMYYFIRRVAIQSARQHGWKDDVFFMSFREIIEKNRHNVPRNRAIFESYRRFDAPRVIRQGIDSSRSGPLRGLGVSPGKTAGPARRAFTVQEALHVERGAILVCPNLDAGWTPILARFAGVVSETGGGLAQTAVACRALGIPTVLGVPHALERIPDGQAITVDGNDGYVVLG